jgi:hypothetical protein
VKGARSSAQHQHQQQQHRPVPPSSHSNTHETSHKPAALAVAAALYGFKMTTELLHMTF